MNDVSVKICGLQSVEVLKSMIRLPIDYIGFVFAKSRRQISGDEAAKLLPVLKEWKSEKAPSSVGVFVNPSLTELEDILSNAPLDIVQLHGQESPKLCKQIKDQFGVKVFKVLSVDAEDDFCSIASSLDPYAGVIDGLLLDTFDPQYGGGSGKTFAWEQIPHAQAWARAKGIPLFIAGGLNPDNVGELLASYAPDGVDVSSGVETDGTKDIDKVTVFVERVKSA
ncbi:phosphoribosylanthranilate isomerase [Paenibacillus sediminis]|uniref:N-(5'-phosphoribosyl)anthranilate isomerase n=1 Tax=Paenibacillus sediminis TaxID=664909 RepID=A0ABS4GZU7_9BACL|nr:phosphoribosylanthranilate isomerase [Paenibacillus sediminis]MBP1935771.1 phosphoribosylanthranilate isomerase [Paenibacillus sediminis]